MPPTAEETENRVAVPVNRGILSERDRNYFLDQLDVESGSAHERMIRQAIRERLRAALGDCRLIVQHMRADDLERVVNELISPPDPDRDPFSNAVALLYLAVSHDHDITFESVVRQGIQLGAIESDEVIKSFEFTLDTQPVELEELVTELEEGDGIMLTEFNHLLQAGTIPTPDSETSGISFHMDFDEPVETLDDVQIQLERRGE